MNHLVSTSLLLLTASGCDTAEAKPAAASATAAQLTVNVRGLRNTDGGVVAYLHASESTFPRKFGQAAKTARRKALDSSAITLRFDDVAPGTYALVVVHDENGNGKLDKNVVGFPKEGIGASNVAKGRPSWAKAKFEVSEDRSVRVTMQYF
jgi:uncharacterized protein (DUF2141 family)